MGFIKDAIQKLSRQLYPNGRSFWQPLPVNSDVGYTDESGVPYTDETGIPYTIEDPLSTGGIFFRLHRALSISEAQLWTDAQSTYDSIFPDNVNFTDADRTDWERRYGIVTNNTDPVTRNQAIIRAMNYPGTTSPRQSATYLQAQLQAAGFNVFVFENIFSDGAGGWISQTPSEVLGYEAGQATLGNFDHGQLDHGATYAAEGITIIANHLEAAIDADFVIGSSYNSTFFITGNTVKTFASIPLERQIEFRQLVLRLKPLQTVAFLFINFI